MTNSRQVWVHPHTRTKALGVVESKQIALRHHLIKVLEYSQKADTIDSSRACKDFGII